MCIDSFTGKWRFLSNFHPAEVYLDGEKYPSTEHAFQAAKTRDLGRRSAIQDAETPGRAKRLGRKVPLRDDWEDIKLEVMSDLVAQKFSHPPLRGLLLDTGERELVEGNTWGDTFWGVCKGVGENHLGQILMRVRAKLRAEVKPLFPDDFF